MLPLWTLMLGCGLLALAEPDPEPSCAHQAWYPDADGDGVGEPTAMYVGCAPPDGYVQAVDTDTGGADSL